MTILYTVVKWATITGVAIWLALAILDWIGPTAPVDLTLAPGTVAPGADLDALIAAEEAAVPGVRDGAARQIVWAGAPGEKTPLSIVYLHGFSAAAPEVRPLPDRVAEALGANLYFARLRGHGRDGAAMAGVTVNDWINDTARALEIGRRIGERVIVMGTSTGGTLAILAASHPDMSRDLAGLVLLSPNLRVAGWSGRVLEWPLADVWGPALLGAERSFPPHNEGHAANWTTRYPTAALAPLGALTRHVRKLNPADQTVPAMFLVSSEDRVVDTAAARRTAARWGAPSDLVPVVMGPDDDPSGHVLAGDILSPKKTAPIAEKIIAWAQRL